VQLRWTTVTGLRLSIVLGQLAAGEPRSRTLGEIVAATEHAAFGVIAGLCGLLSMIVPGLGVPGGIAVAILGAQMAAGRSRPYLLPFVRRHKVTPEHLASLVKRLSRASRWLEKLVRPRWPNMLRQPIYGLCGFCLAVMGVGLSLPLPIPGTNTMFVIPIVFFALGLLEDDGVLLAIGLVISAINVTLCVVFSDLVVQALSAVGRWIAGFWA
jgi:hypothetical protein